jgi:hypothetical protein
MSIAKFGRVYPALRSELWAYRGMLRNPELRFGTPSSPTFSISNFDLVTSMFEKDLRGHQREFELPFGCST